MCRNNSITDIDVDYGMKIMEDLSSPRYLSSPRWGGRNCGSDAEHRSAVYIADRMREMGLVNVSINPFSTFKWVFREASIELGDRGIEGSQIIYPYCFPCKDIGKEGITAPLINLAWGTRFDYMNKDVAGCIGIISVDLLNRWWINYPYLEATLHGLEALIIYNKSGFAQQDDAIFVANLAAPIGIPVLSVSKKDAENLLIYSETDQPIVFINIDATYVEAGQSYNVTGMLEGSINDEMWIVGSHYDVHFKGAMDNNSGTALLLTMAKAMASKKQMIKRDIAFIAHSAEEFGENDCLYDWAIGSYKNITGENALWRDRALMYVNLELPGLAFSHKAYTNAPIELVSMLKAFAGVALPPSQVFLNKIDSENHYNQMTLSDDISYSLSGIPSIMNGNKADAQGKFFKEYLEIYHTQYDVPSCFNHHAFSFNGTYYASMILNLDHQAVLLLDPHQQYIEMGSCPIGDNFYESRVIKRATVERFTKRLEEYGSVTKPVFSFIVEYNREKNIHNSKTIKANLLLRKMYKVYRDGIIRLGEMGETLLVGHSQPINTIQLLEDSLAYIQKDERDKAKACLLRIEDEQCSYYFSHQVTRYFDDLKNNEEKKDKLLWAKDKLIENVDLYRVIQWIEEGNKQQLIEGALIKWINQQEKCLDSLIKAETETLETLILLAKELNQLIAGLA